MTLIGKIFTVLIFVMSILFMGLVMAVYATHKNWRDVVMNPDDQVTAEKPLGLVFQLDAIKLRSQQLRDDLDRLSNELIAEKKDKADKLAQLENENDTLTDQRKRQDEQLARLKQDLREAVAAMDKTQQTLAGLRGEVDTLRAEIRQAQKDRDGQFAEVVRLTDELHQAVNEKNSLEKRNTQLAADYADALEVLRKFDLKPNPELYTGVPPRVPGVVQAVRGGGLIEISIGSDDGLMPGHTLEVFRKDNWLGRVEVVEVSPDKAVARIIPDIQEGAIQVGDRVASKLK